MDRRPPRRLRTGDAAFRRETTIHPERPFPGTADLVESILAGNAFHLNVMPLDCRMPDPGTLVRAVDIPVSKPEPGVPRAPIAVFDDGVLRVTAVPVTHGHAHPALAFRFDTPDGAVVFSGDTRVNDDLIALARNADILVHQVADLGYLERQGLTGPALERMSALHTDVTEVGGVAERAQVRELILNHYLPAETDAITETEWAERAGRTFSGSTIAGRDGLRRTLTRERPDDHTGGIHAAGRLRETPWTLMEGSLPVRPRTLDFPPSARKSEAPRSEMSSVAPGPRRQLGRPTSGVVAASCGLPTCARQSGNAIERRAEMSTVSAGTHSRTARAREHRRVPPWSHEGRRGRDRAAHPGPQPAAALPS